MRIYIERERERCICQRHTLKHVPERSLTPESQSGSPRQDNRPSFSKFFLKSFITFSSVPVA